MNGVSRLFWWFRLGRSRWRFGTGLGIALVGVALTTGCGAASTAATTTHAPATTATPTTTAAPTTTNPGKTPSTTTTDGADNAQPTGTATTTTPATPPSPPGTGTAAAALQKLAVKGRAPKTGYSRDQFGGGWATVAGCATRDRILRRDLFDITYVAGSTCRVRSGTLDDPYTGKTIKYVRGGVSEVDIDHVVALLDAWQKGAQQWTRTRRKAFANDPLDLLAVSSSANRAKGDADAATWLPPNKSFRCDFVARQIAVKRKYGLWVTGAERGAMERVLARCPRQRLPQG